MSLPSLQIDQMLRRRAAQALLDAGYSCREIVRIHAPEDTGAPIECWFVDGDGSGDWVFMSEWKDGPVIKLKVVPDP